MSAHAVKAKPENALWKDSNPGVLGAKSPLPLWVKKPHLLAEIVEGVLELGKVSVAASSIGVPAGTVAGWISTGKQKLQEDEEAGLDTIHPLSQFYLEVDKAAGIFMATRIRTMIALADSGNPEYKNFQLWILENMGEDHRFVRWNYNVNKNQTEVSGKIIVEYADGRKWVTGGREQNVVEGEVIDTKMITGEVEDF